jgi:5-methylcytosine-specific restriction endonuclease McrA
MKLWEQKYGKSTEANDKKGCLMYKAAYGQYGSEFGWDIHHKIPKNRGGTDAINNLEIVHVITHNEIHNK